MKYIKEYLKDIIKVKPLSGLTTKEDELDGMSGEMLYIDGKCSNIFISHADYANWIEKQFEQKIFDYENANIQQKDFASKQEYKFKVGDWVVNQLGDVWHIDFLDKKNYQVSNNIGELSYFPINNQDEMHIWSFQDAIDGDILTTSNYIYIFNSIDEKTKTVFYYCLMNKLNKLFSFDDYRIHGEILNSIPATKEQSNLFFSNMHKSGYKWDSVNFRVIGN